MINKTFSIFFKEKPVLILLCLNKDVETVKTISSLSRDTGCVFCHVTNIISFFEKEAIVEFVKQGRVKIITLTEKGRCMSKLVEEMVEVSEGKISIENQKEIVKKRKS